MKKKIPFSLEYKDKIESGEVEVVTRDDRPVRVICWDVNKKNLPILALVQEGDHERHLYCAVNGYTSRTEEDSNTDLFILVENELTGFEKALNSCVVNIQNSYGVEREKNIRYYANILLKLAEKQLEKKFRIELFQQGYDQALGEAQDAMLESVPKWKHLAKGDSLHSKEHMYLRRGSRGSHKIVAIVMGECDYIDIKELDKLPKEERV